MPRHRKRKFDPPVHLWVIFSLDTGEPVVTYSRPLDDDEELYSDEIVYEYTFKRISAK